MTEVRTLWRGAATLGEGPAWDPVQQVLWFVDIKQQRVHRFEPGTGEVASWAALMSKRSAARSPATPSEVR